jgi:hypothetical protein
VVGSEKIQAVGGQEIDCWKVRIDFPQFKSHTFFWIGKKTREMIKVADYFPNGLRYKVKLAGPME